MNNKVKLIGHPIGIKTTIVQQQMFADFKDEFIAFNESIQNANASIASNSLRAFSMKTLSVADVTILDESWGVCK